MLPLLPPLAPLPPLPPLALLASEEDPDEPPELLLDASSPASELPCPDPPLSPLHAAARTRRSDEERPSRNAWRMIPDFPALRLRLQDRTGKPADSMHIQDESNLATRIHPRQVQSEVTESPKSARRGWSGDIVSPRSPH
jgi:hypothetical protein